MPFTPVTPEKLSNSVTRQIEALILQGVLRPGDRLPSERDLATQLDVSRPSLREALSDLENRGLIVTRRGAGVFIAEVLGSAFAPPLIELFATHEAGLTDYLSFRRDLEAMAAERAASHATDTDRALIKASYTAMLEAHAAGNPEHEARIDADFHMAIVEAAHNVVMLHMMRSMFELLQRGVFYNRDALFALPTTREELLAQHRAICDAVVEGKPAQARAAVEAHMDYISTKLKEVGRRGELEQLAQLRQQRRAAAPTKNAPKTS